MKKLIEQMVKFGVVGAFSFLIDYGLMVFLTEIVHIDALVSAGISFTVSVIFNYVCSMKFVFQSRDDMSRRREFIIFVILSTLGLGINELVMWVMTYELAMVSYFISKIVATVIVMIWNFVTRKIFLEEKSGKEKDENISRC